MRLVLLLFIYSFIFFSCTKRKEFPPAVPADCIADYRITYQSDIRRIVNVNCNLPECHSDGGDATIKFDTYEMLARFARNGSLDFRLNLPVNDTMHMPVGVNMNACDLYKLKNWISSGYPQN